MRSMVEGADLGAMCGAGPLHRFAVPLPRWGRIDSYCSPPERHRLWTRGSNR